MPASPRAISSTSLTPAGWWLFVYMAGYYPFLALTCLGAGWVVYRLMSLGFGLPRPFGFLFFAIGIPFAGMVLDVVLALPALFERGAERDAFEFQVPPSWMKPLYALVQRVACQRGLEPPDDIRLHANTVAHVYEDTKGQRILVVGGAAMAAFSQDALAGIIAHELGHFAGGDTRLSRVAMKWHGVMAHLEARLHARRWSWLNPLAWMIRGYHLLYAIAWAADARRREYAADRHEVNQAGKEVAAA